MFNIAHIIKGTINNLLHRENELYEKRITICKNCALYKIDKVFGEICNPALYINIETGETSKKDQPGFIGGCGCILKSKCRVKEQKCPLKRW